jgi:hypothetical protein
MSYNITRGRARVSPNEVSPNEDLSLVQEFTCDSEDSFSP